MSYALVRQNDQSDCGAAALATVAMHHGQSIGLQQMRDLAGTDRVGTNLLGLVKAAERIGFLAKAVQGPYDALSEVPLPAIAHVRTGEGLGHFVVLHRVSPQRVIIADPAHGIQTLSKEEFSNRWTGYLLLLTPGEDPTHKTETARARGPAVRFIYLLSQHTPLLLEAVFAALLMTLLGVTTAYFIQHLVDSVLARHENKLLNALGLGMVMVVLFRVLFAVFRQYILAHIGRKIDLTLIAGYTRHILGLPLSFFETRQVGEILSRINDASKVRSAISGATTTAIVDCLLVVLMMGILYGYDARLAALSTVFVVILLLSTAFHHPLVRRRSREMMEQSAKLSAHYVEDVSAVETIKAFGAERQRVEEGESHLVRVVQAAFSLQALGNSMSSVGMAITGLSGIAVLWYGGHRVMDGALSVGELVFFHSLLGYLLDPLERLASVNMQLQDALVAVERLGQITDLPTERLDETEKVQFTGVRTAIELRSITFGYGCRSNVLEQLSMQIPRGKTIAIIGESGSGKSTLLKLLTGYYAPTEGQLIIDGIDARDYNLASLRSGFGVVSQEPFIFSGTVRANIAFGCFEATLEQVIEAAKTAGLADFIESLPLRYDTVLGERGANLSGGQRQRLAIARAVLRSPDVLIFDEATSHLDTATERVVQESLRTTLTGKTVILVAHRLSTIKDADLIYVLQEGRVVEQGTHHQMIQRPGHYAALWHAQTSDDDHSLSLEEPLPIPMIESAGCLCGAQRE